MNPLTIYSRGYTAGNPQSEAVVLSSGDSVIDSLFDYFGQSQGRALSMAFYERVLDYAMVQFGDFEEWLDLQLSNPKLVGTRRDYLIETLEFALRGVPRSMSQYSWSYVLQPSDPKAADARPVRLYQTKEYLTKGTSTAQVLQLWCSQKDGINDLLHTLHVLFGHAERTPA